MRIRIFTTGGTIDKIYFDQKSEFQVGEPQIAEVLREANVTLEYEVEPLMRKDSLDLTTADRETILKAIAQDPGRRFLVTHGTDTMVETGRFLQQLRGKVVVLTGALQPARFRQTDAVYNIASAVTAVQLLPDGVYIAMNGRIFDPRRARKNARELRFEDVAPQGSGER